MMDNNTNIETLEVGVPPIETLESSTTNMNDNPIILKKKNKNSKILIILGIITAILIGLGVHYILTINNPKNIFTKASNMFFESLENIVNEKPKFLDEAYFYEGNIKINTNLEDLAFLNNEAFNYSFGMDIKNKKVETGFGLTEENNKLIGITANIKDNNAYIDLYELFDKVILFDNQTIKENMGMSINEIFTKLEEMYSEENIQDMKYIVNSFGKITNKALSQINYEKVKSKISINDKSVNAKKMSLALTKENLYILRNTYVDGILNDNKLLDEIVKLTGYDKKEIKDLLNEYKIEISNSEEPTSILSISIYTTGILGNVVKVSMEEDDREEAYYINYKDYKLIAIDEAYFEINGKELIIREGSEIIATGTVKLFENNNINIDFTSVDNKFFMGNITWVLNDSNIDFNFNLEVNMEKTFKIKFANKTTKISDNETEADLTIAIEYDNEKFAITNTNKITRGANIANINTSKTLNYNDISETDINTIMNNLEARLKGTKYGELMNINGKSNFITDANKAIDSTKQAVSLISMGSSSNYYTLESEDTYCFTLQNLEEAGYINGYDDYEGTITVTKVGNNYSCRIEMHNDEYYVRTKDVVYEDVVYTTKYMPSTIKTKCISTPNL